MGHENILWYTLFRQFLYLKQSESLILITAGNYSAGVLRGNTFQLRRKAKKKTKEDPFCHTTERLSELGTKQKGTLTTSF